MARIVLAACSRSSAGSRISMSAPRRRKSASAWAGDSIGTRARTQQSGQHVGRVPWCQPRLPAFRRERELRRDHLPDEGVLRAHPPPAQPGHRPVVAVLGQQADGHAVRAGYRSVQRRNRRVLRRGHSRRLPVLVRFRWTDITSGSARWEQAFSAGGGEAWLDNWYMDATRRP
jgi:hypothetical protein